MVMTNDEAVAMTKRLRDSRDCDSCAKQVDCDENLCRICLKTADKYFYEEKSDESSS